MMKSRLEQFYESFGDRGIMFILYVFSVVVNSLLAWNMTLPGIYPEEISVAGTAAMYSGIAKWPIIASEPSTGYLQGLFYAPLYRLFNNPFALYKTMLVENALLISFIPMIIYHLASKLGVPRVHQKIIIAVSCGMYISYIVDSKYIWNGTVTALICWLIVLSFFNAWDKSSRGAVFFGSIMPGVFCALGIAADPRLSAIAAALVITLLIARLVFHQKTVNFLLFGISFVLSFLGEHLVRGMISNNIDLAGFSPSYSVSFLSKIFSHLYAFTTTTLGLGALAAALTAVMFLKLISEGTNRRTETTTVSQTSRNIRKPRNQTSEKSSGQKRSKTPENTEKPGRSRDAEISDDSGDTAEKEYTYSTKVYEKHTYSIRLTLFALFALFAVLFTSVYLALESAAPTARLTDDLAPIALFLTMVFIYLYGIDLAKTLIGAGIYSYICICYAVAGEPLSSISGSLSGIIPMALSDGYNNSGGTDKMNYIIMSSCVFSMFALIAVYTCCSRKHRTMFVSVSVFAVIMISTAYLGGIWLPGEAKASAESLEPYRKVSDLLYNDYQSPPIIVYEADPRLAGTIQFLAPHTSVTIMEHGEKAPESCLLVAENGVEVPFESGSYDNVGRTDKYTIYAFGESARDFMRYSSSKN